MMIMMIMVMVMMIQNAVKSVGRFGVVLARRPSRPAHRHDLMKSTQSDYQHYRQHQNEDVGNGKHNHGLAEACNITIQFNHRGLDLLCHVDVDILLLDFL